MFGVCDNRRVLIGFNHCSYEEDRFSCICKSTFLVGLTAYLTFAFGSGFCDIPFVFKAEKFATMFAFGDRGMSILVENSLF